LDLSPVNDRLDNIISNQESDSNLLGDINDAIAQLSGDLSDIESGINGLTENAEDADNFGQAVTNRLDGDSAVQGAYNAQQELLDQPSPFSEDMMDSAADTVTKLLPSHSACSALTMDFAIMSMAIPCERFNQLKRVFSWLLAIWTVMSLIDLLIRPVEAKA
jgi:uncharacterized phage infection (PIP) family protein YhgE